MSGRVSWIPEVNLFVLMIIGNTIPNRIVVVIYLKSIFFLETFVHTDIEISENKKPIRNFKLGCSKAVGWKTGSRGVGVGNGEWGVNTNFSFRVIY